MNSGPGTMKNQGCSLSIQRTGCLLTTGNEGLIGLNIMLVDQMFNQTRRSSRTCGVSKFHPRFVCSFGGSRDSQSRPEMFDTTDTWRNILIAPFVSD